MSGQHFTFKLSITIQFLNVKDLHTDYYEVGLDKTTAKKIAKMAVRLGKYDCRAIS